ncbi:uncharacterized protein [Montipora capricornis]|uniref:uncharacterized protein n=1 Tax=Montipora foliosa TaxID=591990 RepID=UPI0035F19770
MLSLFLQLLFVQHGFAAQCNKDSGPSGETSCVQIPEYENQFQWTTCLTNAYIQQKSNHKHECHDRSNTFCWHQCMLELHNKDNGSVTDDCSCNPSLFTDQTQASLPAGCYSPSGNSCDWYRNCLEKTYPCEDTSNAYALRYAEKFCRLYGDRYSLFSVDGQKWVDGVRKCLQVALVPLLRPWRNPSCEEIRKTAFASHTPCYLNPGKGVPSICDLSCAEYLKIFWTIKASFTHLDTAWESVKGMWNIGKKCGVASQIPKCLNTGIGKSIKITKLGIEKLRQRRKRSYNRLPKEDAHAQFVDGVGSAIAKSMRWNSNAMDWFAHPDNVTHLDDPVDFFIIIVFADKRALGIQSTFNYSFNLNRTFNDIASAIVDGMPLLRVHGSFVRVKSFALCSDKFCDQSDVLAVNSENTSNLGDGTRIGIGVEVLLKALTISWVLHGFL